MQKIKELFTIIPNHYTRVIKSGSFGIKTRDGKKGAFIRYKGFKPKYKQYNKIIRNLLLCLKK